MEQFLPVFFVFAMGLSLLLYVILDSFDLGVGILLPRATNDEKDIMIASIGPFWDANETWIVLGVGIILIALTLPALYVMLGVAITLPAILLYSAFVYQVFRGKATDLSYE